MEIRVSEVERNGVQLGFYPIVSPGQFPLKLQFRAYRKFRLEIAMAPLGDLATQSFGVVDV